MHCINERRSFIELLNSKGLSVEPYGTPAATAFVVLALLLITNLCLNFLNNRTYELTHSLRNRIV